MSTRVKFAALYGLLFALMTLMMGYSVKTGGVKKSAAEFSGFLVMAVAILSAIILVLLFLSWKDPTAREKYESSKLSYLFAWLLVGIGVRGIIRVIRHSSIGKPTNLTFNSTNASVNGGVVPPSPVYHNDTITNATSTNVPSNYILYASLLLIIAGLSYFAIVYYREALKKRERKRMRKKALDFDRKVEELGLEMFSDPREAVVGIYKNAVLWLKVLGIPYRKSWTHWEHVRNVNVSLLREPFKGLTRLFEKAKYAPEKVTWEDAKTALELYRKMRGALNEAA
ncbi:hypothetical protein A3L11_02775 [Thermococcus siculi]|uniref:Protein-glutamine gamma-glutamyltransferase-like C-terminal domain-containing protein n=1 Tax=Thermococcus siculi TaxID=72803 RepID=A0A2Z2MNI6_9EURY|nr:DUF4129 domain-containing protein [Thermococcus siculi]ASJ08207.1 hypothetical protein A3L11_02775 [Thermococcus siculi]